MIISGRNEDAVGKPLIYATSKSFMDYFGINSAEDLPKISEVLMEELVQATNVKEAEENMVTETASIDDPEEVLSVTQTGEIVFEITEETNPGGDKEA